MKQGIVYRSTGSWYSVKANNNFYDCRIVGKFRLKEIKSTNPVAVGDRVEFEIDSENSEPVGIIYSILERKNYLVRRSVNLSKRTHVIAANIDQVFLLITLKEPPTLPAFIDRFIVAAESHQIPVTLLFNKMDTYTPQEIAQVETLKNVYNKIGYKTHTLSAIKKTGVQKVERMMQNKVSMISGHSGVGKSTLINAIAPNLDLKTASISAQHMQGQHTTTFAEMYDLEGTISIIDTPGIKGFGVVNIEPEEMAHFFPELLAHSEKCKFHNCMHIKEPECKVLKALEKGEIAASRYSSYIQLLKEDSTYRK